MHRECVGPAADEIAATLERAGVTTLATADPDRARSLLDDRRVDCVVTELRFDGANDETPPETDPGHPGLALLDTLRERNPTLPVVVYTGADHLDDLETDAANDHDEVGGGH